MTTTAPRADATLTQLAINTIRFLSVDGVEKAKSGHPGMPMGMAPVAYAFWARIMRFNPAAPGWLNRDRFVLSAGHGSMLLYSMLHLTGYDLSIDDLKAFRQWGSRTPGHPEYGHTAGVETTTGPLGQGIATAVGMAMAQKYLNSLLPSAKPLLDYKIYGIAGDGCLMEGVSGEAASLAGHLGLSNIIFVYDDNRITIDGPTSLAFSEDVVARYRSYNWNVVSVSDANDVDAVTTAIKAAQQETARPTLICVRSHIGFGSPNKQDDKEAHGSPLGAEETRLAKKNLGWPEEPAFLVPDEVRAHFKEAAAHGAAAHAEWKKTLSAWAAQHPAEAALLERLQAGRPPEGWKAALPNFKDGDKIATRAASGQALTALAAAMPEIIGGSADLAPSNNTFLKGAPVFTPKAAGRNVHFGVREHAMSAALNGLALDRLLIPYGGTFLTFIDYMKGGMRLSAIAKLPVVYVLTHDSIGLGEDGPTHQPIEQVAHLRATPNFTVIRPADATETAAAWAWAVENRHGPVALILSRQNLPVLTRAKYPLAGSVDKGAYILSEAAGGAPKAILMATGSEVSLALDAQTALTAKGVPVRVVSMPSWEIFEKQSSAYKAEVLPPAITARVSIEALSTFGWDRYTGFGGRTIGMAGFGASAPGPTMMEKFGFTVDNVCAAVIAVVKP